MEGGSNLAIESGTLSGTYSDMHKDRSACQPQKLMPYSKDLRLTE